MLYTLLSNRLFLSSFVIFVIIIVTCLFYDQYIRRETRKDVERTQRTLEQVKKRQIAIKVEETDAIETDIPFETQLPLEVEDISDGSNKSLETIFKTIPDRSIDVPLLTESKFLNDETFNEHKDSSDSIEIEKTVQFVNTQFATAAELYYEKFEIKSKRRQLQYRGRLVYTRLSPADQTRLQEIQYETYDALTAISEKVPGAIEVKLSQSPSGFVGCEKYLFPHVFEEVLGQIPDGYYQFSEALAPFLNLPIGER